MVRLIAVLAACLLTASAAFAQHENHGAASSPDLIGSASVKFQTSCVPPLEADFNKAVALLHSFWFPEAIKAFEGILGADGNCAMAHWGIAMSQWGNPFGGIKPPRTVELTKAAIEKAKSTGSPTPRERAYIDAVAQLVTASDPGSHPARIAAYEAAMEKVARDNPNDTEAMIFYALAVNQTAPPTDKTYANQRKAGAILEQLFAAKPDHPRIAHYLIHTYDVPSLAAEGLPAANRYAVIAPASAHALHMPSHTFTRVGKWDESIATNIRSARAAEAEGSVGEALHASDYMMYAYLQTGRDTAAARLLAGLPALAAKYDPNGVTTGAPPAAAYFAMAAIPARYALERGDWRSAVNLQVRQTTFPFTDAITWFAKGLGGARSGDTIAAAEAVRQLERLRDTLTQRKEAYWSQQVEIQRRGLLAWLALARGARDSAIAEMRTTADLEATTEKNAITPGPIVPARELLAEMLLLTGDAAGAQREFEATLGVEPDRFRAIAGAMRAATTAGNAAAARRYATQLVSVCEHGDRPGRADLAMARRTSAR